MLSLEGMTYTENNNLKTNRDDIIKAIDTILEPIANTMSPRGANVLFRANNGKIISTNDGATIASVIRPENELQRMIVDIIVEASENTNKSEGDATSTTILLTSTLLKYYIDNESEFNSTFDFISHLRVAKDYILEKLPHQKLEPTEILLKNIAFISGNNDSSISDTAYEVAMKAGDYGIIGYNINNPKTEYTFDDGYIIYNAIPHPMFINNKSKEVFNNIGIFITNMQMFYQEHLDTILKEFENAGHKNVIIIAPAFTAKVPDMIAEIVQNEKIEMHVIPIEIEDEHIIGDIASYTGVKMYTKGTGTPDSEKLSGHIGVLNSFTGTNQLAVLNSINKGEELENRITMLKSYIEEGKDIEKTKERLASLTTGVITLSPGGDTDIERTERQLRFDDSIRAVQRAKLFGCLPGGGVALKDISQEVNNLGDKPNEIVKIVCEANIKQIQKNCGLDGVYIPSEKGIGFNALTRDNESNMVSSGVIDSYPAVEQALKNSFSTAEQLVSAINNSIITNNK